MSQEQFEDVVVEPEVTDFQQRVLDELANFQTWSQELTAKLNALSDEVLNALESEK